MATLSYIEFRQEPVIKQKDYTAKGNVPIYFSLRSIHLKPYMSSICSSYNYCKRSLVICFISQYDRRGRYTESEKWHQRKGQKDSKLEKKICVIPENLSNQNYFKKKLVLKSSLYLSGKISVEQNNSFPKCSRGSTFKRALCTIFRH